VARDPELQQLEQACQEALDRGDRLGAAELHVEAATKWLRKGERGRAEFHLVSARDLARKARHLPSASRYARTLARLHEDQARFAEAVEGYREAAAQARVSDAAEEALKAEVMHAEMLAKQGQHVEALALTNQSLDYAVATDRTVDLAALLRNRARHEMSLGRHGDALQTLAVGIDSAKVADDPVAALRLAWSRHQLERGTGQLPTDDFEELRARQAAMQGVDDVGWEMELLQASLELQAQKPGPAAQRTRSARDAALKARNLPLYLQACLLLGDIEVAAGRRHAALMVLLAAHQNLERLIGPTGAAPVKAMLERFRRQWGDAVFDQAFADLRAHVEAQRPPTAR